MNFLNREFLTKNFFEEEMKKFGLLLLRLLNGQYFDDSETQDFYPIESDFFEIPTISPEIADEILLTPTPSSDIPGVFYLPFKYTDEDPAYEQEYDSSYRDYKEGIFLRQNFILKYLVTFFLAILILL